MTGSRISRNRRAGKNHGYILLTMLLFVALLAIGMTAAVVRIDTQVKRDREEEMIHRGVQYARAIRLYVKKFGRYPTQLKDLEDTNNMHFLRRAYKDPITGKDFKLLHLGDVKSVFSSGIPGASPVGGNPGIAAGAGQPGMPQGVPITDSKATASSSSSAATASGSGSETGGGTSDQSGTDDQNSESQNGFAGQVFGGGPILGVASISKEKSIRVFNKEDHYNQWQFIYDPSQDRGGLITTPYEPSSTGGAGGGIPGAQPEAGNSSDTNNSTFGKPNPMQQPQMPPEGNAPDQ